MQLPPDQRETILVATGAGVGVALPVGSFAGYSSIMIAVLITLSATGIVAYRRIIQERNRANAERDKAEVEKRQAETSEEEASRQATAAVQERDRAQRATADAVRAQGQVRQVLDVARMLTVTTDLDLLLRNIAQATTALLSCDRASVFLYDKQKDELWSKVALQTKEIRFKSDQGIAGHAFTANELIHVANPYEDPRFNREPDLRDGYRTRNLLTLPLLNVDGKPVGILQAVNKLSGDFQEQDHTLIQLLAGQAGVAIQRYQLQQAAIDAVGMRREMELARQVQEALIPSKAPQIPTLDACGWTQAASMTGGDCYDLWKLDDGRLGVFLGDASGHGIGPALMVSQVRTMLRAMCNDVPSAAGLLERINRRLVDDLPAGRFVTAFVALISQDGAADWCSYGQGPLFVRFQADQAIQMIYANQPPLGITDFPADQRLPELRLGAGSMIAAISDGFFEAPNAAGERFGIERMAAILERVDRAAASSNTIDEVRRQVRAWQGHRDLEDDQTIVVVRPNA